MTSLFVFGTLRDPELLALVLGRSVKTDRAHLQDHAVFRVQGAEFPICVPSPGKRAEGLLIRGLDADTFSRLDFYECGFGYTRAEHGISVAGATVRAQVYVPLGPALRSSGEGWSLAVWQRDHGALTREVAREAMALAGAIPPEDVPARWPVWAARAQTRLNARHRPATRREGLPDLSKLEVERVDVPVDAFFRVEDHHIRFPNFAGGVSKTVSRVAFVSVDAVTVLPYDPVRDRVLLVDQFRTGAYARGDTQPWMLEPVAGRVDGGETWEQTAHREAQEEAGVLLTALEFIGRYYPSPGALTEYLISYVGLCDLPDGQAGLFGVASEAEDIRTYLVSFDTLMEMCADGRVQTGPLLLSAYWLAANRPRLRQG
ncbi:gamma-glutamylcyclotransferase [Tropicimonas sp. S265A]|uniref:gamma-glutamylcyclotransferase n=1 Tax=Tropicimonas sp. S265A TaxID=3415134 RepID=UPI003C7C9188